MQKKLLLGMLFLQLAFLRPLSAMTITSGTWSVTPDPWGAGYLTVSGPGFFLQDVYLDSGIGFSGILIAGTAYYPNYTIFDNSVGTRASATINGVTISDAQRGIYWGYSGTRSLAGRSFLTVTGTPIVLPPEGGTVFGTFQLSGSLCGVRGSTPYTHSVPLPCEIDVPLLTGSGTYRIDAVGERQIGFRNGQTIIGYNIAKPIVFTFADPTADVPEPATVFSLAGGLGLLLLARSLRSPRRG